MTGARFVLCTKTTGSKVIEAAKRAQGSQNHEIVVLALGDVKGCIDVIKLKDETDEELAPDPVVFDEEQLRDKLCITLWSSGTTGKPKGICHTHLTVYLWGKTSPMPYTSALVTTPITHLSFWACVSASSANRISMNHVSRSSPSSCCLQHACLLAQATCLDYKKKYPV